jgi:BASS family bile acid:Na+ symporter
MLRLNDWILVLVLFSSMLAGILFPVLGSKFRPFLIYFMMSLLFLSLIPIRVDHIRQTIQSEYRTICYLSLIKLIALPLAVYYVFKAFWPAYAVSALLLSGISTGVVAPFIANMVGANSALVLVMVVVTSPLVPFTLPVLVKLLLGQSMTISLYAMMRMLCMVIFIPILLKEMTGRIMPKVLDRIGRRSFPISLTLFAIINLGVFSRYADFFRQRPSVLLYATLAALLVGCICLVVGIVVLWRSPVPLQVASAITLCNVNNVLVIVFAAQFFSPLEPTVAAMYMVPFFGIILPLRVYRLRHHPGKAAHQEGQRRDEAA